MTTRSLLIALATGVLLSLLLYYPLAEYLPSRIVADWPPGSGSLAAVLSIASLIITVAAGWAGARASAARSRAGAVLMGAATGAIAGAILYMAVGGAAAGVWGSRILLSRGLQPAASDPQVRALLSLGALRAHVSSLVAACAIPCAIGLPATLGGLIAPAGTSQATAPRSLGLRVCSWGMLGYSAALGLGIMLWPFLGQAVQEAARMGDVWHPLIGYAWVGIPLGIAGTGVLACAACQLRIKRSVGGGRTALKDLALLSGAVLAGVASSVMLLGLTAISLPPLNPEEWLHAVSVAVSSIPIAGYYVLQKRLHTSWTASSSNFAPREEIALRVVACLAGAYVLAHALYAAFIASAISLSRLVVPFIGFHLHGGAESGLAGSSETLVALVRENYTMHLRYAQAAVIWAVLVGILALLTGMVSRIWASRRSRSSRESMGEADGGPAGSGR